MPARLAEILIETGLADCDAVMRAAQMAEDENVPLVAVVVHRQGVDELAVVTAIKRHVRVAIADPAQVEHDAEAMRQISRDVCWRLRVMPLALVVYDTGTKVMKLAMADPTDTVAIAEVEHVTDCQVEGVLMPLSAIEELVDSAYGSYVTEVIPRDRVRSGGPPRQGEPTVPASESARDDDLPSSSSLSRGPASSEEDSPSESSGAVDPATPTTVPYHRVTDEASLEIRHQALLTLLLEKDILNEEEYHRQVKQLMKQHSDEP